MFIGYKKHGCDINIIELSSAGSDGWRFNGELKPWLSLVKRDNKQTLLCSGIM